MSINVSQAFKRTSANPVDETLALTKTEMLAINDNLMPNKYLTVCQDDGYIYLYDKSATPDAQTGKFSKFEGGGQVDTSKLYSADDSASTDIADGDYFPFYDTSATSKKKSLWSNVKSVLKTYFDGLYQKTLTAGANITIDANNQIDASMPVVGTFSKGNLFDTTEKVIGKWIDGRPLYQKTISTGTLPNATEKNVAHGISNINYIAGINGIAYNPQTEQYINMPTPFYVSSTLTYYDVTVTVTNTYIQIHTGRDWSAITSCYFTLQYTKTTDSANSYAYTSENDYSTSEKIVGTWVDGSTLYQKTYIGTTSSSGSSTTVDSSFTYKVKRFFGALSYNSTSINNGGNIVMIGYGIDSNEGRLYAYTYNNKLYLWGSSSSYNFNNRGYALTVQYTK